MLLILIGLATIAALVLLVVFTYTVVDPNDAHIVVFMGRGRNVYSSSEGSKSSYFFIPILMKRFVLPLTNQKIEVSDIHLNDLEVAPFICDVITWLHINNPEVAAERLNLSDPFGSLREDLINVVQAVARAVSMKKEVLDIMRDRQSFSEEVTREVGDVLEKWGVELVNLEVNDIRDDLEKDSTVITDYESRRKALVRSKTRQEVASRNREAVEVEENNRQKAEIAKAVATENYTKRQIEAQKQIGISDQEKEIEVAKMAEVANEQKVNANRALEVGNAEVQKQSTIEIAEGEGEAVRIKGEKEAQVIDLKGTAEASALQAKGQAEAVAKDKMAQAMQKFNNAAINVEKIRAIIEIEKKKYDALGSALSQADLKLVNSGDKGNLFGFPISAQSGADLGQMIEAFGVDNLKDKAKEVLNNLKPKKNG